MKDVLFAAACVLALPVAGNAATVSAYSASALIDVTLVSAAYSSSGADAYDALTLGYWQDITDFGGNEFGAGTFDASVTWDKVIAQDMMFGVDYRVDGYASPSFPYSSSGAAGWITPAFYYERYCDVSCSTLEPIDLTFDFGVSTSSNTTIFDSVSGTATSSASAVLGFQKLYDGGQGCCSYDLQINDGNGRYTVNLMGGEGFGLDLYVKGVAGEAEYTAPPVVPLPAAMPLLLVGLAGFGFLGRRSKKAA